jgi:hypothetical protein
MNTLHAFIVAASSLGFAVSSAQVNAQEASATPVALRAAAPAYRTGMAAIDSTQAPERYDLELTLTAGPHHAAAKGVKVTISGTGGDTLLSLDDAGAVTDVALPSGHYRVLADFGRIKHLGSVDVEPGELATLHLHGPGTAHAARE